MANNTITPFVKRMRVQGGTLYTFSSAVEDIGLNINERNNIVKVSNFALLDIPEVTSNDVGNLQQNRFNVLGINGALKNYNEEGSIKDGRVLIAESFQNYALNVESNLLNQESYNPALLKTVSERVFWKWLKETGAIRWIPDNNNSGYYIEEGDTDSSSGYNSIVKYIGEISAGSIRTDSFGTYNETYVLVPTSHGQTRVYFDQTYDDNYFPNMSLWNGQSDKILGRDDFTKPHPDGLSMIGQFDVTDSSTSAGSWGMEVDASDGLGYVPGSWYTAQGKQFNENNFYVTDSEIPVENGIYNYNIRYTGPENVEFKRSNIDGLGIEYNINNLKNLYGDENLTFDKMAIESSVDDSFDFNSVLVYYTVYNKTLDKILAINLLGILFLDAAVGNTSGFPDMNIVIPAITKRQSGPEGFGSSYSFRINIKSDNMFDDTQATIYDESTSSQTALTNWTNVFANLEKSVSILNQHTNTINYITNQYSNISGIQTAQENEIKSLKKSILIEGPEGVIPMYGNETYPLVDSSLYMKKGKIGIFTNEPKYDVEFAKDIHTKNIIVDSNEIIFSNDQTDMVIKAGVNKNRLNSDISFIVEPSAQTDFSYIGVSRVDNSSNKHIGGMYFDEDGNLYIENADDINLNQFSGIRLTNSGQPEFGNNASNYYQMFHANEHIIPRSNNMFDIGENTSKFNNSYINNMYSSVGDISTLLVGNLYINNIPAQTSETNLLFWNSVSKQVSYGAFGIFSESNDGLVPAAGTPSGRVLSDNGTWISTGGTGSVSNVSAGNGMNFADITGSGSVIMGTPSSISLTSNNTVLPTSHTHNLDIGIFELNNTADPGLVPGSDNSSTKYLKANGIWGDAVYAVHAGNGMTFSPISGYGTVTLGTPGDISLTSSNVVTSNGHHHRLTLNTFSTSDDGLVPTSAGLSNHFLRGDGTWQRAVTSISTSGSISGGTIISTGTISHLTTDGHKHLPSGGSSNQWLKNSASGTGTWANLPVNSYTNGVTGRLILSSGADSINADSNLEWNGSVFGINGRLYASRTTMDYGTSSAPTYSWENDADTGIYHHNSISGRIMMSNNAVNSFMFEEDGTFHALDDIIGFSTSVSDIRLKTDMSKLSKSKSLDIINKLNPIKFKYIDKEGDHFGFIAQELEVEIPEVVVENEVLGKEGIYKMVRYQEIIPHHTAAIQELKSLIDDCKQIINQQSVEIKMLKEKLNIK